MKLGAFVVMPNHKIGINTSFIYAYFGVNIDIVWQIATVDILEMEQEISKIKTNGFDLT